MRHQPRDARLWGAAISALAGYVDAIGFVSLGGYFASFMSGNSTRLGVEWANGQVAGGLALLLIALFVAGAAAGTGCARAGRERAGLVVLAAILIASAALHDVTRSAAIGLAAFAMGALNTLAARHLALPVGLTYMTGTLIRLGEALGGDAATRWHDALPYLLHWLALVLGAMLGAIVFHHVGGFAMGLAALGPLLFAALGKAPRR